MQLVRVKIVFKATSYVGSPKRKANNFYWSWAKSFCKWCPILQSIYFCSNWPPLARAMALKQKVKPSQAARRLFWNVLVNYLVPNRLSKRRHNRFSFGVFNGHDGNGNETRNLLFQSFLANAIRVQCCWLSTVGLWPKCLYAYGFSTAFKIFFR